MEPLYAPLVHVDLLDMDEESEKKLMDAVRQTAGRSQQLVSNKTIRLLVAVAVVALLLWSGINPVNLLNPVLWRIERYYYEYAADNGDADALNNLGVLYSEGHGVKQDYAKARDCYERAAEKGHVNALFNLGIFYDLGKGVPKDYSKAQYYYEQAAAQGNASALCNLGYLYGNGLGVEQDYVKALDYYEQAATKGNKYALYNLGIYYENGFGVSVDYANALEYYQKAADAGHEKAPAKVEELREKLNG